MRYGRPQGDRKDQKMVHAVTMCCGRPSGNKKSRKWSLLSPCGAEDLAVTKRAQNGPRCHRGSSEGLTVTGKTRNEPKVSPWFF